MEKQNYMVTMEWALFQNSVRKRQHYSWYLSESQEDAKKQAIDEYGKEPDFKIISVYP